MGGALPEPPEKIPLGNPDNERQTNARWGYRDGTGAPLFEQSTQIVTWHEFNQLKATFNGAPWGSVSSEPLGQFGPNYFFSSEWLFKIARHIDYHYSTDVVVVGAKHSMLACALEPTLMSMDLDCCPDGAVRSLRGRPSWTAQLDGPPTLDAG